LLFPISCQITINKHYQHAVRYFNDKTNYDAKVSDYLCLLNKSDGAERSVMLLSAPLLNEYYAESVLSFQRCIGPGQLVKCWQYPGLGLV